MTITLNGQDLVNEAQARIKATKVAKQAESDYAAVTAQWVRNGWNTSDGTVSLERFTTVKVDKVDVGAVVDQMWAIRDKALNVALSLEADIRGQWGRNGWKLGSR